MSETNHAPADRTRHPIVALLIDNPISAINAAMILVGGAGVYYSNEARMAAMEKQVARIEEGYKIADADMKMVLSDARQRMEMAEGRNAGKIEAISSQMSAASVKLSSIETAIRFLVEEKRRRPND